MNKESPYYKLLAHFLEEPFLASLAGNVDGIPFLDIRPPVGVCPYPPALIPIWASSAGVQTGLWSHCTLQAREATYVRYYGNAALSRGDLVVEISRTLRQLVKVYSLERMVMEERLATDLEKFCLCLDVDLTEISEFSREHGDDPEILRNDIDFRDHCPLSLMFGYGDYNGGFPCVENNFRIPYACLYEVHSWFKGGIPCFDSRHRIWLSSVTPEHLKEAPNRERLFDEYLERYDFSFAWLLLNRSGWTVKDLRGKLVALAESSQDSQIALMADCWTYWNWDDSLILT